jgi:uncharacterized membrane protein
VLALLGIPLALQLIAPNSFYGIRTSATLNSAEVWYRANLFAGLVAVLAGTLAAFINVAIVRSPRIRANQKWWFTLGTTLLGGGAMVVAGLLAS